MKNDGWTTALFALVFLAGPGLAIVFFALDLFDLGTQIGITFGFLGYGVLISVFAIWIKWISVQSLTFNLPITIVMAGLMFSYNSPMWVSAIIAFVGVMTALPINIYVNKYAERRQ